MKTISGKRMCQILESKGWALARITGSHHIYIKEGQNLRITVPVHGNQDLKQGLQRAIMRLVGIGNDDL
ncbi:MAG: type II toxin-antitoxin system HicA family toxin [Desulfobacterales bacterium]|nr:type II toxin-antitoxin system HicA family toxin [Desulfobacterales bacterium]